MSAAWIVQCARPDPDTGVTATYSLTAVSEDGHRPVLLEFTKHDATAICDALNEFESVWFIRQV